MTDDRDQGRIQFRLYSSGKRVRIGDEMTDDPPCLQFKQFLGGAWTEWKTVPMVKEALK